MAQTFTRDQVAQTSSRDAETLLTIIDSRVYDLSEFMDAHPGGETVLKQVAGKDATSEFYNLHRHEVLVKYSDLCVGTIDGETGQVVERKPGDLSVVPYGEPTWLTPMYHSPYFGESHKRLRKAMREFMEVHVEPEAREREESGETISDGLITQMAEKNVLAMRMGPGKHLYGRKLLDGAVEPEEFNYFHDLIVAQETGWISARGFMDGNMAGMTISLSVILKYCNSESLKKRITEECLSGKKKICLAVTEAFAGSDVAGMRTEVRKDKDGSYYISGTKKWITNGIFCDYFITAAKTPKGMSVFLVERGPGLETQLIRTSYSAAAGTAFVTYDNVKVPAENLLGEEDKGFAVVMNNFNHERWFMSCAVIRQMRVVTEECLKWSNQRMVFGKKLIEQPVIRGKLAKMISHCEANQAYLENITHQMQNFTPSQQRNLGGPIGLLKMFATRSAHEIADEAVSIFGGRALTKGGMGRVVEMFHRTYKFDAILGGAEEILGDLGVREAVKKMPKAML